MKKMLKWRILVMKARPRTNPETRDLKFSSLRNLRKSLLLKN